MNTLQSETTTNINLVSAKIEVERHILYVTSVMNAVQRSLDLLIDSSTRSKEDVITSYPISHHLDGVADERSHFS
jgi:hypothetical protein